MKLDRVVAKHQSMGRSTAHRLIAAGRVRVDGGICVNNQYEVDRFTRVDLDHEVIRPAERSLYLMMHKPPGILSATTDSQHTTVIDLIEDRDKHTLHIAGRLDRATSGLVLLTNDGRWSKRLMEPDQKVPKTYLVETADPIAPEAIAAFAEGFYFHTEDLTTRPAQLEILEPRRARLTIHEGRYHQVKRMFHRINNRVVSLHRESIGALRLPDNLPPAHWRELTPSERLLF
ncbi:MAG TPA: pseudouridine synthase [Prosthecobacter sp.]|nr:pseudouridine synthase [Prosthecobacter sp.]